ncbi:MAG: hypothetical protein H0T73_12195 [Ardenticatenales bacterium]|nr:hypothetical protein [Ardenticatenales bacterium]
MRAVTLEDLQLALVASEKFRSLEDCFVFAHMYLDYLSRYQITRISSPAHTNYIFYQYGEGYGSRMTRPLNTDLFIEDDDEFEMAYRWFESFLQDAERFEQGVVEMPQHQAFLSKKVVNQVVYTLQQSVGCVADSLTNANRARKRVGQTFEALMRMVIQQVGVDCQSRTIRLPIPGNPGYYMPYELDLVFSRKALITSEINYISASEIVGSVKTTSKDRIDKIFLDKYLLSELLGRDIPVVALFLHDVQRANKQGSPLGIASTFKKNHFLGYTVALKALDGVYYVDPLPNMLDNELLRAQIRDFQFFLTNDLWTLAK